MLFFVLWVIFLVAVLLAVPVAAQLEKRRYRAAHPEVVTDAESAEAWSEVEASEDDPVVESDSSEESDEPVEFGEVDGGDDFSAFDEIE